jgi:hypothetical protein
VALLGLVAACATAGCRRQPEGYERYVPSPASARNALIAALDAWRAGKPAGPIDEATPKVVVVDNHRPPGRALGSYEILGEVAETNAKCFAVRIHLAEPDETQVIRYMIFGLDPVWVFRREDYDMISHWEHPMTDPDAPPADTPEKPSSPPIEPPSGSSHDSS